MADGDAGGTPSPIRRLVDRFQSEKFSTSATPSSALPLVDITAANVSFRTNVVSHTDDADSSSPLVRSLLARVQRMDVQSALPASGMWRRWHPCTSPSPQPGPTNPKRKLYSSPVGAVSMCGLPFKRRCGPKANHACRSSGVAATAGQQVLSCAATGSSASGPQAMQLDGETHADAVHATDSFASAAHAEAATRTVQLHGCDMGTASMVSPCGLKLNDECLTSEASRRPCSENNHAIVQVDVALMGQDEEMRSPLPNALLTSAVILERGPMPLAAARIVPRGVPLRTQQPGYSH